MCCVEGKIYLIGGDYDDRIVTEYNPRTNNWRNMQRLQTRRYGGYSVCTLENKIFVLGGFVLLDDRNNTICEMLDLSDDNPQWRYIAERKSKHRAGEAAVIENKIYVVGHVKNSLEVYDVDQGNLMKYSNNNIVLIDIFRSLEMCYQHAN